MSVDAAGIDRALGAIGTTFRLARLYPPAHPAVVEALRQVRDTLHVLAATGTIEWKVGATGLHWHGQHLVARNSQITELAGLLYARGVRAITLNAGMIPENLLALFGVATGTVSPDDATLGRITLTLGRRTAQRLERLHPHPPAAADPTPAAGATPAAPVPGPPSPDSGTRRASAVFRPDVLPADVEARRAIASLRSASLPDEQRAAVAKLLADAPSLIAQRDALTVAEAIVALDRLLVTAHDPGLLEAIDTAARALTDRSLIAQTVHRLGEPQIPPDEREVLVAAVGALAAVSVPLVLAAFLAARSERRAPYRAAIRKAADRAVEPLQGKLADPDLQIVAAAAELMGLTASPHAVLLLVPLLRHRSELVREAALIGLAEVGGHEISRPAMPALKDESVLVRTAAARAVAAGGDPASSVVLIRRLEQEPDEGVLAELLRAVGRLGAPEALEVLAKYAEPGGVLNRRHSIVRAGAIEGLRHIVRPEARGLLQLYSRDKDAAVRRAAEAALA